LGVVYFRQDKYDEAVEVFKEVAKNNPKNVMAYNNLGLTYQVQGKLNEAIKVYTTAININPNHAKLHKSLGIVYSNKAYENNTTSNQAVYHFKKFITLARTDPDLQSEIPQVKRWIQILGGGEPLEEIKSEIKLNIYFTEVQW